MKNVLKIFSFALIGSVVFSMNAHADGDIAKGETIFNKKCKVCHTTAKGDKAKVGPNLWGIHSKQAGQFPGYKYSKGILDANLTWDDATLDAYLTKPRDVVKRGKMVFAGLRKEKERQDMIAYLKTLQD